MSADTGRLIDEFFTPEDGDAAGGFGLTFFTTRGLRCFVCCSVFEGAEEGAD